MNDGSQEILSQRREIQVDCEKGGSNTQSGKSPSGPTSKAASGGNPFIKIHGLKGTRIYEIWQGIKKRCFNPHSKSYPDYGGRGIGMHPDWVNDVARFWRDVKHGYSDQLTIDRINTDGDYEPGNIRWSDRTEQSRNRRNARLLEFNGKRQHARDWERQLGLTFGRLHTCAKRKGITLQDALNHYAGR